MSTRQSMPVATAAARAAGALACIATTVALAESSTPAQFDARAIDGRRLTGIVLRASHDHGVVLQLPPGETARTIEIEPDELDTLTRIAPRKPQDAPDAPWLLEFRSGERLRAEFVGHEGESLLAHHPALSALRIPLDRLTRITRADAPQAPLPAEEEHDVIELANGDVLRGLITVATRTDIAVQINDESRTIPWERIRRIELAAAEDATPPGKFVRIDLVGGSRIIANELRWSETSIEARVLAGQRVQLPIDAIARAEWNTGRRIWLSDLPPVSHDSRPLFGPRWPLGRDRGPNDLPLRAHGREYARGVALHSAARVTYALQGDFDRFRAAVAIDDSAGDWADADVRILADDREVARIDHVRRGEPPQPIDVDVRGANMLTIRIEYAAHGDIDDRVDLLDAALIRGQ